MKSSSWPITSLRQAARSTACNCVELLARRIQSGPVDVFVVRRPADGRLLALGAAAHAVDDPLEDAHVLAEARPEELAVLVLAEPVDVEDARRYVSVRCILIQWRK